MASRRRPTTALVLASLLCLYDIPHGAFSLSFSLDFSDAGAGSSIIVAGDAVISPPTLQLTKNSQASYRYKVPLWNGAIGEMASFATAFSFQITPEKDSLPQQTGDRRMAFFLGHLPSADVARSSSLADGTGDTRIVAVEFDALLNHVGIDINSTASAHTTAPWPGKNLTPSSVMEATVKYHNGSRMLAVALLIDGALYQVNATVNLRRLCRRRLPSASSWRMAPARGRTGYCRGRSVPVCRSQSGKHLRLLNLLSQPAATATRR